MTSSTSWLRFAVVAVVAAGRVVAADCEAPGQAGMLIRQSEILLLGEIHGTSEGPELVAKLVCEALLQGEAVTVGLELPRTMQDGIDSYVAGDGSRQAKIALLDDDFWKRDYQDGRSSLAMMELIESLRTLRADEHPVEILAFDVARRELDRDRAMALEISRVAMDRRDDRLIVLTGNLHARQARGRAPGGFEPMGYHLGLMTPGREIVSLNLTHSGGTAWVCTGGSAADCGSRRMAGSEAPPGLELFSDSRRETYSGRWHLGPITASPPAKRSAR